MTCPNCGAALQIGEWPFCPHGAGQSNVIADACDVTMENGWTTPRHFTSKAERLRALKEAGYEERVANAGPLDKHCRPWNTIDAQTLENGRILVSRPNALKGNETPPPVNMRIKLVQGVIGG